MRDPDAHIVPDAAIRPRANLMSGFHLVADSHDGSYQHLRAELGEENTNRLITNIGTLAMTSGLEASGVSLSDAVKRIIGSLTPAERSAIASGGAPPPRVQALLDSELKAAQQQQKQTQLAAGTNPDGTSGEPQRFGAGALLGGAFARGGYSGRGDYSGFGSSSSASGSSSSYVSNPSSVSMLNYAGTPYAGTGMAYGTFNSLRSHTLPDGSRFSGANILHAGQDAARQQFSPNDRRATRNLATLDRYDPAGRETRNRLAPQVRRATSDDPRSRELLSELSRASTPEQIQAVQAKIEAHKQLLLQGSGWNDHVRGLPEAARAAGRDHGRHLVEDELRKLAGNDPALLARLQQGHRQSAMRTDQHQTPEQIQSENRALLDAAGNDPEKQAAARRLIEMGERNRAAAEQARAAQDREVAARSTARAAGSEEDDAFGPASRPTSPSANPAAPAQRTDASPATPTRQAEVTPPAREPARTDTPAGTPATAPAAKKEEPKKISATPSGRAAGPV